MIGGVNLGDKYFSTIESENCMEVWNFGQQKEKQGNRLFSFFSNLFIKTWPSAGVEINGRQNRTPKLCVRPWFSWHSRMPNKTMASNQGVKKQSTATFIEKATIKKVTWTRRWDPRPDQIQNSLVVPSVW